MSAAEHRQRAEALLAESESTDNAYDSSVALMKANLHASLAISEDLDVANGYLRGIAATDQVIDAASVAAELDRRAPQ